MSIEATAKAFHEFMHPGSRWEDVPATVRARMCDAMERALAAAPAPDMLAALKAAQETLTAEDACNIAPIVGSDNPHEHAAGLVAAAIAKATRAGQ